MKSLQELCEMEDEELCALCTESVGWKYMRRIGDTSVFLFPPHPKVWKNRACTWTEQVVGKFEDCEKPDYSCGPAKTLPKYTTDLNACTEFESILFSHPNPAKMSPGEQATPLQRYEYALTALEPEKPLWAKSARTKTISFIYSKQTN